MSAYLPCLMVSLCLAQATPGPETDASDPTQAEVPLDEQLLRSPDDRQLLDEYMIRELSELRKLVRTDPERAQKHLDAMNEVIQALDPMTEESQQLVDRAKAVLQAQARQIELARVSLPELADRLLNHPDDDDVLSLYRSKLLAELMPLVRVAPERAERQIAAARELLATLRDRPSDESIPQALRSIDAALERLEKMIEINRRRTELIGQSAAELDIEAWVNGEPLTDDNLRGQVVLLDFWAVWCGPCLATFPHLREWHEAYADRGLQIIGVTGYYGYTWDEEAGRPRRSSGDGPATKEQEQQMLANFAEHHELPYPFAIPSDGGLHEYYAVSGIPQAVLIDRAGKIRLIRVGSGEQNAADIAALLAELLGDGSAEPATTDGPAATEVESQAD